MSALALIVAAGRGERLGGAIPKAFVDLGGRPMLEWSVRTVQAVAEVGQVVVALPEGRRAPEGTLGVAGGATRSESVRAALAAGTGDPVIVHDAARPLVTPELVRATLAALDENTDAAIAAAPVTDTIKRVDSDGRVAETLDRAGLWAVQTPQVFRRQILTQALDVDATTVASATDDAWLVERAGGRVRVVAASPENIKVTTALDLRLAEQLLSAR
ncbi:MAG TPA: 2-C-methyl-D-erythritol 4-phosphate cytidylyltransferase [Solirubrobacteraceae bacterium]|nr:2-C-methyl-D-erythritol 4-phosphate cytidylyltransferase [Solirubrobacteraceae bacterium]